MANKKRGKKLTEYIPLYRSLQIFIGTFGIVIAGLVMFHNTAYSVNEWSVWVTCLTPLFILGHPIVSVLFPNNYARRFTSVSHIFFGIGSLALAILLIVIAADCDNYAVCISGADCDGVIPLGASGIDNAFVAIVVLSSLALVPQALTAWIVYVTWTPQ